LKLSQHFVIDKEALQGKIYQLIELKETRRMDFNQMVKNQDKVKGTFECKEKPRGFKHIYLVLMWDKRRDKPRMYQNFESLWLGPYKTEEKSRLDSFYLTTIEGRRMPLPIN
jgi:hypothetical protein